ncbi:hypothetical protein K2X92_02100 [Candidatus Gracilibacteria bacterium]|nr:hypothetical protein [Candidatus Gracilibacteria bacterium]
MFTKFVIILASICIPIGNFSLSYAHPLDVSNTTLTLYEDNIIGVTYIHPVELDRILVNSLGMEPTKITIESYYTLTGTLTKYLQETFLATNQGELCVMGNFEFREGLMIDEIYSGGFPISYTFSCSTRIDNPMIQITFLKEVPLQTNRLYVYRLINGEAVRSDYKVLNAKKDTHTIDISLETGRVMIDSDGDGLSDDDEILYATNPNNKDTDSDGYNDNIEIQSSWNPVSKELSPGQKPFDTDSPNSSETINTIIDPRQGNNLSQDSGVWGGERFRNILRDIRIYADDSSSSTFWLLLFSIGVLGFLHALGPGHSKGILISQIIDDEMSYTKSILYCLVFTCIHLIDIVVVVAITKIFFNILDPSVYLSTISRISAVLVLGIGLYLSFYSIRKYRKSVSEKDSEGTFLKKKNYLIMAFIAGLTPCAFGWSIFLMLLAIGKMSLAPPLLLALGIGIFLCLLSIATVTAFMRNRIYRFAPRIGKISPIVSSVFIVCIGFTLMLANF